MARSVTDINKDIIAQGRIIQDENSTDEQKKDASKKLLKLNAEVIEWLKDN
jgi:hypothetical protein